MKNILDNHPEVKKAIEDVNSARLNLSGFYWREAVITTLALQYQPGKPVIPMALDWAEMLMVEYENDNG